MHSNLSMTKFRTLRSSLALGLFFAGSALAAGCDLPSDQAKPANQGTSESLLVRSQGRGDSLLVLGGELSPNGAITRIASDIDLLTAEDLGLSRVASSADAAAALPAGTRGVALDLATASDDDLRAWRPILDGALQTGVPLILENAMNPSRVAGAIGVGVGAELIMVTSDEPNRFHVHAYGDNTALTEALGEESKDVEMTPTTDESFEAGVAEIGKTLSQASRLSTSAVVTPPPTGYKYFLLDFPSVRLQIVADQQYGTMDLDFEAELVLDSARGKKVLFVRPVGSGQHPGALYANGDGKRGYYQDFIRVSIVPTGGNEGNVSLYDHQPASPNNATSYTSSTGWTVGVSGDPPELSYSTSDQETTTLPDFSMINDTSGQVAKWTFKMSRSWEDMVQIKGFTCKVRGVPTLAKSNLRPNFEALYRSQSTFNGTVDFRLEVDTGFREVSRTHYGVVCTKHTNSSHYFRTKTLSVNFGAV